jgi:hypothetical protein
VLCAVLALPLAAHGRPLRPRFEPTDLELETPGTVEVDLQVGFIQGQGPYRVVAPDVEIDVGILTNLELDLDWTYALEQPFDHSTPDNVWVSFKLGLLDVRDPRHASAWALGLQLGPRLAAAPTASGAGFEALVLAAHERRRVHLVLNAGAIADPPMRPGGRPIAFETGLDLAVDIDSRGRFSLTGAIAGVFFLSSDPHQLTLSAGVGWSPRESWQLTLTWLVGLLDGSDRYGVLLGYSQKLALLRPR